MVLYLSSIQHTNLLDFTGFYEPDSEMPVKKMVGNFVLKQFVVYDMRSFAHFTDVVLDRPAFGDTDEEFAQAIQEFLTMYSARVTVICEGLMQADPLFQALLDCGVGNIVCDTEIGEIQQEIRECLSAQGMTRYAAKERPDRAGGQEHYQFDCKNVAVAVVGSQSRIGVTTAAVGLSAWLARVGASVCYVEAHAGGQLAALARGYEMETEEEGWQFEGVHYRRMEPRADVNFVVYDLGSDLAGKKELVERADIKLLVCGTKPYELGMAVRLQASLAGIHAYLLCPFVAEGMKDDLAEALQNDYHKVMFSEYQPELTDSDCNAKQYKNLIARYIAG
nr:hypothetical protein [uncultured Blautia sp.]